MRQQTKTRRPWLQATALLSALLLLAAACGDDSDNDTDDATNDDTPATDEAEATGDGGDIEIGWIPWDEDVAVTWLWDALLTEQGYDVSQVQLDAGIVYLGLSNGDFELFLDAWLPDTHAEYWAEYGDDVEDLGVWNDSATLHLTVPSYVDIDSIADLADRADDFNGQIVGIDPSAGLMQRTADETIPTYGLDDYELLESTGPVMIQELATSIDNEEWVVVTLWRPHWAYAAFDLKDLEDPEGTLGDGEDIKALGREGFSEEFPEVAEWIGNFFLDSEQLNDLTNLVIEEFGPGNEADAIQEWLDDPENRALADSWIEG